MLHFTTSQSALASHNLIMGIAIAVMGLGISVMPERMYGMSWAICAMGAWTIVSTWIVGNSPDTGVIINNVVVGGLAVLLGLICAGASMRGSGKRS